MSVDFASLRQNLSVSADLVTDLSGYEEYCRDATEETGEPAAILFAADESDVIAAMQFTAKHDIAIVPRGTGTGLSGGAVPCRGCLLLSMERIRQMHIDPDTRTAVVGPGVITKELMDAAAEYGLTYPPDPASYRECSLGGNVAENAGGLRCKRFGITRDYVTGLRAVTAGGELLRTGSYNELESFALGDLLIGSEGTLAVVTEMTVRLIPQPKPGSTILVAFDRPEDAAAAVSMITRAGIIPTVMEYLDGDAAECSNRYENLEGLDCVAAILLIETSDENSESQLRQLRETCEANRSSYLRTASSPEQAEELWKVRRNLSKAIRDVARFRYNEDVAVPVSEFTTLIAYVSQLNDEYPVRINAFGHAGDGNLHVSFLSMTGDDAELDMIKEGVRKLYRRTVDLGGTLTGEHGIGRHKGEYMTWEFDPATLRAMRKVKDVFDPDRRLNPDKIWMD
jgi:glycolate oxidase